MPELPPELFDTLSAMFPGARIQFARPIETSDRTGGANILVVTVTSNQAIQKSVLKSIITAKLPLSRAEELRREIFVLTLGGALSLPTPRLLASGDGDWVLMEFIEGLSIADALWQAGARSERKRLTMLQQLGVTVARFHNSLAPFALAAEGRLSSFSVSQLLDRQKSNLRSLQRSKHDDSVIVLEQALNALAMAQPSSDRLTLCHGDLSGHNMICDGKNNIKVIDWSDACVMPRGADVAFLTSRLNGLCRNEVEVQTVINGYERASGICLENFAFYRALDEVTQSINLLSKRINSPLNLELVQNLFDEVHR